MVMALFLEAEAATEHASGGMPQLDFATFPSQIFWLAVAFVILYLALDRFLIPRIGGAIEERKDRIADDLDMAARMKDEADAALVAYEKSLAEARAKAHALSQQTRDALARELDSEAAQMDARLAKTQSEAEARIAAAREKALQGVDDIALDVAGTIVQAVSGMELSPAKLSSALKAINSEASA